MCILVALQLNCKKSVFCCLLFDNDALLTFNNESNPFMLFLFNIKKFEDEWPRWIFAL